jgi:lipid-A-disaccharide synthase
MKIYVIAGEPSGDLHGKNLVAAMQQRLPGAEWRGVGGDGLESLGVKLVSHVRDISFMGFIEVVKNLGKIKKLFRAVKQDIESFAPDVVILIDYPGFNLKIARFLEEKKIKTVYYISPKVWAWKKSRVKTIKECVDRMLVILPFEKDFYAAEGMKVDFVGHPLLDEIQSQSFDRNALRASFSPDGKKIVALLPGSRNQEIQRMLPVMLQAAEHFPDCRFIIAGAPNKDAAYYAPFLKGSKVTLIHGRTYDLLAASDYAFVCSGTATLETALFNVPQTVCYAANWLSVQIAKRVIQVKYISLVNLIMDRAAVTELIQSDLTVDNLCNELKTYFESSKRREKFAADYKELRTKLGEVGASARAADCVIELVSPH